MKKFFTAVILLCGCLIYADTQISWKDLQNNIDSWIQGPPSLILTSEEKETRKRGWCICAPRGFRNRCA